MNQKTMGLRAAACGFLLAAAASLFPFAAACETLPQHVLRLRVVANSNGEEDQQVKLLVRDAVLEAAAPWLEGAATREEATSRVCAHLQAVAARANAILGEEGFSYGATAQVAEEFFPTRQYQGFRLPAGRYLTLRVTLGAGEGRNWWCVVFPGLCLPAAGEDPLLALPEGERRAVGSPQVEVKWKAVELWQSLREMLAG